MIETDRKLYFKMRILDKKKGLSAIVATVILIALTIVIVAIIWASVSDLVNTGTEEAESCFNLFEKVSFERKYTCYNSAAGEAQFSIKIGDLDIDEVLVGIATNTTGKSFSILRGGSEITGLRMYDGGNSNITIPGRESGETYIIDMAAAGLEGVPVRAEIIPVVGGTQCEVIDTVQDFGAC